MVLRMRSKQPLAADTPLRSCRERNVGLALSDPISDRLDSLVSMAETRFGRTSRKELVASLILAAPTDEESLLQLLSTYRQSTADSARLDGREAGSPLSATSRKPGPRRR